MSQTQLSAEPIESGSIKTAALHQDQALAAAVLAFSADPVARWMYPNTRQYLTYFPCFVEIFGGKAFEHNTVYLIHDDAGAAFWFPPNVEPDSEPLIALLDHSVMESIQGDLFSVLEQMGHYHPHEPHWYLAILGVDPAQHGKGYGSALMQHGLLQCDRHHMPAYLESSNPANLSFYERHGFEVLGTIQVGASPPIFPMLRHPR
ncbi:MAG TPA: GNAT family N-acetyltransferase [Elainellaceae cyanobacterium]